MEVLLHKISPEGVAQEWQAHPPHLSLDKDRLIDPHGLRNVPGEILSLAGVDDGLLRGMDNGTNGSNDGIVHSLLARVLQVPTLHAMLPLFADRYHPRRMDIIEDALVRPERFMGDAKPMILAFGKLVDNYTPAQWVSILDRMRDQDRKLDQSITENYQSTRAILAANDANQYDQIGSAVVFNAAWRSTQQVVRFTAPEYYTTENEEIIGHIAGLAVMEISGHGELEKEDYEFLYLPKFSAGNGRQLTIKWLQKHP